MSTPDYYKLGIADDVQAASMGRTEAGQIFVWPERVRQEKEKTAFVMETLNDEVSRAKVRSRFKDYWSTVYGRWKTFHEAFDLPLGTQIDKAIAFRREAYDWRGMLEKELRAAGLPAPTTPPPDKEKSDKEIWGQRILAAGGIALGVWAIVSLVKAFRSGKAVE